MSESEDPVTTMRRVVTLDEEDEHNDGGDVSRQETGGATEEARDGIKREEEESPPRHPAESFAIDDDGDDEAPSNGTSVPPPPPPPPFRGPDDPLAKMIEAISSPPSSSSSKTAGGGGGAGGATYHPEYLFCGECTGCADPPPPALPPQRTTSKKKKRIHKMKFPSKRAHACDDESCRIPDDGSSCSSGDEAFSPSPASSSDIDEEEEDDEERGLNDDANDGTFEMSQRPKRGDLHHRTRIRIANLTCPSQILVVKSILEPLPGVTKIVSNMTDPDKSQTVYVDHDPLITSATELTGGLREMGYDARVRKDGGKELLTDDDPHGTCRSSMYVGGICCNSEVPAVKSIAYGCGDGVSKVSVNVTARMVYVDHDPFVVTIRDVADALNGEGFDARVKKDGMKRMPRPAAAVDSNDDNVVAAAVDPVGRSAFRLQRPLTDDDVPILQRLLSLSRGVRRIGINVSDRVVYVEHDTSVSAAASLRDAMAAGRYPCAVAADGSEEVQERSRALWSASPLANLSRSKYVESTLLVPAMGTLADVRAVEKAFRQNYVSAQVRAFYPHVPSRTIKVEHDPRLLSASSVVQTLSKTIEASVNIDGAAENLALPAAQDYDDDGGGGRSDQLRSGGGMDDAELGLTKGLNCNVILSGLFWVLSMIGTIKEEWVDLEYAGLFSVIFGLPPVAAKAWRTLRRCQFDANCMMVIAALGALALQEFDEAASVAFLFAVSEWLEARATAKARRALGAIASLRPDHANVVNPASGEVVIVPASTVPVGSLVSVRTGDKIPADGVVVEGTSTIDESSLTGEARPATKSVDDDVSGGSINVGSTRLVIRTTSSVEDSAVSRLVRLVEEAQANRSPTEKLVDSFAKAYTPVVMLVATVMCTVPWIWGSDVGRYWTLNGLIIVVIACPCALTISTPVTYAAGLAATAQMGVIVKGGARLESLGHVQKVVFDKTGTLTHGKFALIHLDTVEDRRTRKELLELLSLMEAPSSHPLSDTLVTAAKAEGVDMPMDCTVSEHTVLKGEGVTAKINGETVYVGNPRLFRRLGMYDSLPSEHRAAAEDWNRAGGTVGFAGVEGAGIVGIFCVSDSVREEARDVVEAFRSDGVEVLMLTGDGDGAANAVAREVGVPPESVRSQLLPEDKLHFIGNIKFGRQKTSCNPCGKRRLVLMCGDGVNDAPALAVSDVGVAMGGGAALAMEMSDVTLMDSNLTKLVTSVRMGNRVIRTIQQNIVFSLLAKLVVVGLTFAGKMTLLTAIASDVGVMLVVTLNGMKLLSGRAIDDVGGRKGIAKRTRTRRRRAPKVPGKYDELPVEGRQDPNGVGEIV